MPSVPSPRHIHLDEIVSLLAPTLGQEKSEAVVAEAARALALPGRLWEVEQATALLDALSAMPGLVGNVARFARMRALFSRKATPAALPSSPPSAPASAPDAPPAPPPPTPDPFARGTLVGLLASTLGQEKSEEAIAAAMRKLGLFGLTLDRAQALLVLEDLALSPGLVGVTARFAKARLLLRP